MLDLDKLDQTRVAIIGLGYVGLPLAIEFGRHYDTVGFDINAARVAELQAGRDSTLEASPEELAAATGCATPRTSRSCATVMSSSSPCRRPSTMPSGQTSVR